MKRTLSLLVLPLLLAGCTGAPIPDDAVQDTHDAVPDGTLHGWLVEEDGYTQIVGRFDYTGIDLLRVNWIQPHGYWNLTIIAPDGDEVLYDDRPARKDFDEVLQGPFHEEFYFTWMHDEYERYQRAGTHEDIPRHDVPNGTYTVLLDFMVWGRPDDAFRVAMPIVVG